MWHGLSSGLLLRPQARAVAVKEDAEVQRRLQLQEEALAAARQSAATAQGEAQATAQRCTGLGDVLAAAQERLQQLQVRSCVRGGVLPLALSPCG